MKQTISIPVKLLLRLVLAAWVLLSVGSPPELRGEETKAPPATSAKPDRAQLEAQFKKADADRASAKEKTKERADAAKNTMQLASDLAWLAFDSGKFDEAANWFAKSAELKDDSYIHARGYWEEYLRTGAVELDGKVEQRNKTLETQLAAAEESKKEALRKLIHGFEKLRYTSRYNTLSMLEQIAREHNDYEGLLKYTQQELDIRRLEMAYLKKAHAPNDEIDQKTAQLATSLERVSGAQADLALFDQSEKTGLEALALRRALPESMPERKLEESLSALARMYAFNVGDLLKARDYYQQALTSIEASGAVRQKALTEDRFVTPEQKAGMTKEELAKH